MKNMVECRLIILPEKGDEPRVVQQRRSDDYRLLAEKYPQAVFSIQDAYLVFRTNEQDPLINDIVAFLDAKEELFNLVIEDVFSPDDLAKARFLPLAIEGDGVDQDENGRSLNAYPSLVCPDCSWFDDRIVPTPYLISMKKRKKKQELFNAAAGLFIASARVAGILNQHVKDQIDIGSTRVVDGDDPSRMFFWVRPRFSLGRERRSEVKETCPSCQRPIETRCRLTDLSARIVRLSRKIALDGSLEVQWDIALAGNFYGRRTKENPTNILRPIYISGKLFGMLLSGKVNGLCTPKEIADDH